MMIVYKYTNITNGKVYIGVTSRTIRHRHQEHMRAAGDGTYFHNAIAKYGIKNFELKIIDQAKNKEELAAKEKEYIKKYNSFAYWPDSNGYNETTGGDGLTGLFGELNPQFGISVKERMGDRYAEYLHKVRTTRARGPSHHSYGKHPAEIFGEEAWAQSIEDAKNRWSGPLNPQKLNPRKGKESPFYGRRHTEESKAKQRATREANGKLILGMDIANEIRSKYAKGMHAQEELALEYGVSRGTISDIVINRIYKVENLGYDRKEVELMREKERLRKISKPIAMIDETGQTLRTYGSTKEASIAEGWSTAGIKKHLKNRVKKPRFIYLEESEM